MKYHIKIIAKAEKDLDSISGHDLESIKRKILPLSENPRPFGCQKLTADEGYRIRCGDYRILYRIDDLGKEVIVSGNVRKNKLTENLEIFVNDIQDIDIDSLIKELEA